MVTNLFGLLIVPHSSLGLGVVKVEGIVIVEVALEVNIEWSV